MSDIFRDSFIIMLIMVLVGSIASGIDSAVAGNFLTVEAVSAIGIIYPFAKLLECISKIFSSGVQIVCSSQLGEGKMKEVNRTFSSVAVVLLAVSIVITVIVIALKTPLSLLFGARAEAGTLALTEQYLFAVALGTPGSLFTMFLIPMLQMDGDKKRVNTASIVMMLSNVAFSTIAVVCFGTGIEGIGYGTAFSYYASTAVLLTHFASKKCRLKFNFREADFKHTWKVISTGSVAAAKLLVSAINNIVINNLVAAFGDVNAMAAFSIFKATKHFFVAFDDASADAVRLLTGMFQAEKDRRGLRQLFKSAFGISFIGSAIISILLFIFAEPFFSLFITGEALSITVILMRIFVVSIIVDVAAFFYLSYFQCLNKKSYVLILILCMNGLSMLAAWVFGAWWGVTGIWWSIAFSDTLCAVVAFVLVFINNKKISFGIDSLMMIPDDFGGREEDKLDLSIEINRINRNSIENKFSLTDDKKEKDDAAHGDYICQKLSVSDKKEKCSAVCKLMGDSYSLWVIENKNYLESFSGLLTDVRSFCTAHEYDSRKTNRCLLVVEEIISNILKYGFGNGKNSIDLRIVDSGENLVIRIRDNGRFFNTKDFLETECKNPGVKMKSEELCLQTDDKMCRNLQSDDNMFKELRANYRLCSDDKTYKKSQAGDRSFEVLQSDTGTSTDLQTGDKNDFYSHNGMKIIKSVCSDIEYVNAYGLNCLTIVL